jgi:hypothetical protein
MIIAFWPAPVGKLAAVTTVSPKTATGAFVPAVSFVCQAEAWRTEQPGPRASWSRSLQCSCGYSCGRGGLCPVSRRMLHLRGEAVVGR